MTDKEGDQTTPIRLGRSEVEKNYYRLLEDPQSSSVLEKLRKRGWDDEDIAILVGEIARIPENWRYENESLPEATKRRARLVKALRNMAKIIAIDRDLGGLHFGIVKSGFYVTEQTPPDALTLARLLEIGANLIAPASTPSNESISPVESSRLRALRLYHPNRRPLLKSYAIRKIFEKLKRGFDRAPNKEAEILAGVLLEKPIKPGAATRLRKKTRENTTRAESILFRNNFRKMTFFDYRRVTLDLSVQIQTERSGWWRIFKLRLTTFNRSARPTASRGVSYISRSRLEGLSPLKPGGEP